MGPSLGINIKSIKAMLLKLQFGNYTKREEIVSADSNRKMFK
jgi:hypothetical protein